MLVFRLFTYVLPIVLGAFCYTILTRDQRPPRPASQRFGGLRPFVRGLAVWVSTALALQLMAWLLPGVTITGTGGALIAAAVLGVLNALVWPLLVRLALPLTVLTLGLGR